MEHSLSQVICHFQVLSLEAHFQGHVMYESRDSPVLEMKLTKSNIMDTLCLFVGGTIPESIRSKSKKAKSLNIIYNGQCCSDLYLRCGMKR